MRRILRDNGLGLVFGAVFLASLVGQALSGQAQFNEQQVARGAEQVSMGEYLTSSTFAVDVVENWQSEYLQFLLYVVATVWFMQRGSPESKEADQLGRESEEDQAIGSHASNRSPHWAATGGWRTGVYSRSLPIVMGTIFVLSWGAQSVAGWAAYNAEQLGTGWIPSRGSDTSRHPASGTAPSRTGSPRCSAVGSMAVFAVYLRQRGSPESKPVGAAHSDTGQTGWLSGRRRPLLRAERVIRDGGAGYGSSVDLQFLRDVIQTPGPCATVYLDASHNTEDAAHAGELRWFEQRAALAEQGADTATLDALDAAVRDADPPVGLTGRVLVARGGTVLLDEFLPEPPAQSSASWSTFPDLLPMLLDQPEPVPAVVVRVDKNGGEVLVTGLGGEPEQVEEVVGEERPLHKVRGGGWAHLRMQHKVEETWRRNVADVAARVDVQVVQTGARVLVLAGEEQSRTQLRKELGERAAAIAVDLEHSGGSAGPGHDELAAAVARAVRDVVTAERHEVLERYDQAAGRPDGLGVEGLEPVLAALRADAVDTLLLDGGVQRDTSVWVSQAPTLVATSEDELRAIGAEPTEQVPADAALLRAAAGSGAAFVPVGGGRTGLVGRPMADGVAALLRYPLPTGA